MPINSTDDNFQNKLEDSIRGLLDYCQRNNWAGYDPYDALNSDLFKRVTVLDSRFSRLAFTQFLKKSPTNFRKLLMIPTTQNPKALALFLKAFLKLSGDDKYDVENDIITMVERIKELRSPDVSSTSNLSPSASHRYWCWGYSFPWQGRTILVPSGAANLVCTVFVADALIDLYKANQLSSSEAVLLPPTLRAECLSMATSAAEYILNELYWEDNKGDAGFSYPVPSFKTRVHNANFLAAALFCKVYKYSSEKKYLEPALKAARYSAGKQLSDGSWYYGEHHAQHWVDNFHTGYNLDALKMIYSSLNTDEFGLCIRRGFDFYLNNFFTSDNLPKYFHNKLYPIDIHAVAQSIITLTEFRDYNERAMGLAAKICQWATENMQDKEGYFYYQKNKFYTNKIPYMRWSQAWMLYALAIYLSSEHN